MKDVRLPKPLLLSEFAGGRGRGGAKKTWSKFSANDLKTFRIPLTKWITLASNEITWAQVAENGIGSACNLYCDFIKEEEFVTRELVFECISLVLYISIIKQDSFGLTLLDVSQAN